MSSIAEAVRQHAVFTATIPTLAQPGKRAHGSDRVFFVTPGARRIPDRQNHPYVERRPGVCGGEPVIVGTRFPVRSVVTKVYRLGLTPEEIVEAWPHLTLAQLHDALSFYHDHRRMIDRAIRENREAAVRRRASDLDGTRKPRGRLARDRR